MDDARELSHVLIGPPRRIWKEIYNEGRKETDPLSYFIRVGESGKDLREEQPHLPILWSERNIPEGDRVIWLDQSKNELEERKDAEYKKNMKFLQDEIADLNKRESPLLKSLEKLLLPKISHLGPEVFMRWSQRDESGRYILARNNRINGLLIVRMLNSGMIPILSKTSDQYSFFFKPIVKSKLLTFSIDPNPENNPIAENLEQILTILAKLINTLKYFVFSYRAKTGEGHAIIFKRRNPKVYDLIDPNSESFDANLEIMTPICKDFIIDIFRRIGIEKVELIPCTTQSRGNCFLWSLFFALNIDKEPAHALNMIDDVIRKVKLPINNETRDNVLLELMYGFLERPVPASLVNEAEFTIGLGKSKYKKMRKYSRSKLRGGISPENLDAIKNYAKLGSYTTNIERSNENPLAFTFVVKQLFEKLPQFYKFILAIINDKEEQKLNRRTFPLIDLFKFISTEPYTITELYKKLESYSDLIKSFKLFNLEAIQNNEKAAIQFRNIMIKELLNAIAVTLDPFDLALSKKKGMGKVKRGKAMPEDLNVLQQIAKQSYNLVNPQEDVSGWELKKWTPTMKFYVKGNEVIVGVRGTKANAPDGNLDVSADLTIPFNGIPGTTRYKRDKAAVQQFLQQFPSPEYSYYAVGHSLGGAVIDSLIRDGLIKEAVSYNPAIQYNDINGGLPNRRIYYGSDPLYRMMGWWDKKSEHREPQNRTWADFLGSVSPAAAAVAALPAHNLSNFEGGKLGKKVVFT